MEPRNPQGKMREVNPPIIPAYACGTDARFQRRRTLLRRLGAVAGAIGVAGVYRYMGRTRAVPSVPAARSGPLVLAAEPTTRSTLIEQETNQQIIERIYQVSIVPLLADFDERNEAAAQRAIGTLHDRIQMHKAGIAPFTRDIASWKTRFGVMGRYSSDLWRKVRGPNRDSSNVARYVNDKFRRQVLSEDALQADVLATLAQFNEDMQASRNRLYGQLALPLQRIKAVAPAASSQVDRFQEQVQTQAAQMMRGMSRDTVVAGLAAVAGGWIATDVAQGITTRLVTQVLARIGTAMAAEGIEAGGATAGGAAAGGGGGSFAGPLGTIIGIGVGLIVGAIIDWRMSKRFEQKVSEQCASFLDLVESRLRDGAGDSPGLRTMLLETVKLTGQVQRDAIHNAIQETWR